MSVSYSSRFRLTPFIFAEIDFVDHVINDGHRPEQESWTMCSSSTPYWSATDEMQSLSQFELRKLGVMMEKRIFR
ncbi:MAG: hypothetical protein ACREFE_19075 [Limisphaerales bacterium]